MTPDLPLRIETQERQSPLWLKLRAHYEQRLQELREQNDGYLDPVKTEHVRGRIAEVKAFLEMEDELPGRKP